MPTYRTIPDDELTVGNALKQTTMQSLKDNIDALFQGDDTSPPILMAALVRETPTAGNHCILSIAEVYTGDDDTFIQFKVRVTGTYRMRLELRFGDVPNQDSADGVIESNAVSINVNRTNSGGVTDLLFNLSKTTDTDGGHQEAYAETTSDQSLNAGDTVTLVLDSSGNFPLGSVNLCVAIDDSKAITGAAVYALM